jgi:predicted DNA-binding protein
VSRQYTNFVPGTIALRPEQRDALQRLSERTGDPQQVLLREAVDDLLRKYAKKK